MFRKSSEGWLKHVDFMMLDLICLQLSFVISYMLRHGFQNPYANQLYRNVALFLTVADIAVIFFYQTFKGVLKRGHYKELNVTIKHVFLVEVIGIAYLFSMQVGQDFSRIVLYTMAAIYVLLAYTIRLLWKRYLRTKMKDGGDRSLLIVTTSDIAEKVLFNIKDHNYEMFRVTGLVITDKKNGWRDNFWCSCSCQ